MSVRHVVIWSFLDEVVDQNATYQEMASRLNGLVGVVPGLLSLELGHDLGDTDANWDVVLISEHESVEALEAYQQHPAHLEVAAFLRQQVASRAAVDYLHELALGFD